MTPFISGQEIWIWALKVVSVLLLTGNAHSTNLVSSIVVARLVIVVALHDTALSTATR